MNRASPLYRVEHILARALEQMKRVGQQTLRPSSRMVSGRTAFIAACVATGTKAGVRMSPCGVWMMPVRP